MTFTGGQYCKVDIIKGAYSQLRISGITRKPTPEDLELALVRLEDTAAEIEVKIATGYAFEDEPDPNTLTNMRLAYKQAFETKLAYRLMGDFGKSPDQRLTNLVRGTFSTMSAVAAMERIQQIQPPRRMPVGSGNTLRWSRWARFYRTVPNAPNSPDTNLMTSGDIDDFVEHFDSYLKSGEVIDSFSIVADSALEVQGSSNTDSDVNYRIKAGTGTESQPMNNSQITIIATTDTGRVETRVIYFNITPNQER